ncbi:RNA-directed DNA polymerase, eukaryota [Tanacetum coccineum]
MAFKSRSNADHTRLISKSIFITNFPDVTTSKDLWVLCQSYGTVVDVFIPNRMSKAGKRFAFVRFIKVDNVERLVGNLCTLWIGRKHLQANVARFDRDSIPSKRVPHKFNHVAPTPTSFVSAVKGVSSPPIPLASSPALVLDDSCMVARDLDNFVMGEVRQFSSINNLSVLLHNEGFMDIEIVYLGGLWVMIKLGSAKTKLKFMKHTGVASWFVRLCNAQNDFVASDRIVWVDIEGVPLHAWSHATFHKIGSQWGEVMELEDGNEDLFARKRLCIKTKHANNILDSFKIIVKGKVFQIRAKELFVWSPSFKEVPEVVHCSDDESVKNEADINVVDNTVNNEGEESDSEAVSDTFFGDNGDAQEHDNEVDQTLNDKEVSKDPFNIYDLLNRHKKEVGNSGMESSIPYPPGFTPEKVNVTFEQEAQEVQGEECIRSHHNSDRCSSRVFEEVEKSDINIQSDGRVIRDIRKEGGSILDILDEMIKVGQTMGFTMDGCTKDMEKIIGSNGGHENSIRDVKNKLSDIDKLLDQGGVTDDVLLSRMEDMKQLQELNSSVNCDFVQKAKVRWAIEGDENSKFFHGIINRKRANLSVKGIMIEGEWVDDPIRVKDEFRNHFADRFNDPGTRHGRINFSFPNRLTLEQVSDLEASVSDEEIRKAVWGCGENKSPGPDGFTFEFFRKFWTVVGPDFCIAVKWFFEHGFFATGCNSSFVTLIPKTLDPKLVSEFRPISLIGSLYKVVTKILATRLSFVISDLISNVQTAFLPNRQILDGPFIINEILARCKHKNQQAMFFKVDFAKAYDSIRWDYLDDVLNAFGFGSRWRSWIQGSLNSGGKASVLVNGRPTSEYHFIEMKAGKTTLAPFFVHSYKESLHLSYVNRAVEAEVLEEQQLEHLVALLDSVVYCPTRMKLVSDINGDECLSVLKTVRNLLDDSFYLRADISYESEESISTNTLAMHSRISHRPVSDVTRLILHNAMHGLQEPSLRRLYSIDLSSPYRELDTVLDLLPQSAITLSFSASCVIDNYTESDFLTADRDTRSARWEGSDKMSGFSRGASVGGERLRWDMSQGEQANMHISGYTWSSTMKTTTNDIRDWLRVVGDTALRDRRYVDTGDGGTEQRGTRVRERTQGRMHGTNTLLQLYVTFRILVQTSQDASGTKELFREITRRFTIREARGFECRRMEMRRRSITAHTRYDEILHEHAVRGDQELEITLLRDLCALLLIVLSGTIVEMCGAWGTRWVGRVQAGEPGSSVRAFSMEVGEQRDMGGAFVRYHALEDRRYVYSSRDESITNGIILGEGRLVESIGEWEDSGRKRSIYYVTKESMEVCFLDLDLDRGGEEGDYTVGEDRTQGVGLDGGSDLIGETHQHNGHIGCAIGHSVLRSTRRLIVSNRNHSPIVLKGVDSLSDVRCGDWSGLNLSEVTICCDEYDNLDS